MWHVDRGNQLRSKIMIKQGNSKVMQRRIILDSAENARDLGGCLTEDGRQTRWRSFVRIDHLQAWTPETQQALIDYGVKLIIDLRDPYELLEHPSNFSQSPHVTYLNVPVFTDELHLSERFQTMEDTMTDRTVMYKFIVDECGTQLGNVLTTIASYNAQTTLFHCYAGKDRTGLIAALLLSLSGVPDNVIAEDYELTKDYLNERLALWRSNALTRGDNMERFESIHTYAPRVMLETLQHIREQHDSIANYLRACDVSDVHMNVLRAMLIDNEIDE
jgi:protein-tyrosine phosphatase